MKTDESCSAFFEIISDWTDGELPAASEKTLLEHLDRCASCRRYAESLRALKKCLASGCGECSEAAALVDECVRKFLSGK
ncbi:MAG TPA: zf-HC2 domain-containing protein [Acidobacteriota bacterium]|jgi:anti-sigma factor RsiW|nr:zf-HC2 domain-containing protein [Acidobacteriota bacterium]HQO21379.1 zf-HC2 domain-containing protein [Acidobacteriota bacterium]HQQ47800.1 zf-HC2 domain-containing protein [Acidobacteriota bacterium]